MTPIERAREFCKRLNEMERKSEGEFDAWLFAETLTIAVRDEECIRKFAIVYDYGEEEWRMTNDLPDKED